VSVDLVVLEGVEVEDNPLQVYNENVGGFSNELASLYVYLLLAVVAPKVIDDRAFNHPAQTLIQAATILHLHTQVVVAFKVLAHIPARRALGLGAQLSSKDRLKQVLLSSWLQKVLKSAEEEIDELLGILL
jgi:hypothetical protein